MREQRNIFRMKKQNKTLEQLNETGTGNLPEKEIRDMTVKTIQNLRQRKEAHTEKLHEMLKTWKN